MIPNTYKQAHPSLQFLILIGLSLGIIGVGYLIGTGIVLALYGSTPLLEIAQLNFSGPYARNVMWILQIISTTIPLLAVPVFFAYVIVKDPADYLKPSFKFSWILLPVVFAVMFVSSPLIELLSNINQKLVLPGFMGSVQQWMRDSEDKAQKLTTFFLQMKTVWGMLINVIVIGLFTAIAEEFMFRGCVQTIFTRLTKNHHAGIWITAALFSAFHMEFFGFLPRMMLGVLFGYFVAWSGSIWPAVWAHFLNNGTAVVATYLFQQKKIKVNPDDQHLFNYGGYVFSFIIVLFLLRLYRNIAAGKKQLP